MKLAYIANTSLAEGWAHSVQIMNMCEAFAENGEEIVLLVPNRSFFKKDPFEHYKMPRIFSIKKLPCIDLFAGNPHPFFYWLRFISFYISARFYIWFNGFDFLYSRDFYAVLFFPNIILEQHSFPSKISYLHKLMLHSVKRFIVLTSFIKKRFMEIGVPEGKILIAPDGVDLNKFGNFAGDFEIKGLSEKDFVYGYIGTLKTMGMEKGIAISLKALTLLPVGYKFLVVGGEKIDVEYYKNMSIDLGVSDRVIFTGEISYSNISKYATKCDVFVAPFPENEHYNFYMSPLKIFEYMASKKPIIATNLPSLREVLTDGENALLIPVGHTQALADAIIKLKENPEYGRKIAEKAYLR